MYSYRHSRLCLCQACARGDEERLDRALDASIERLAASMATPEPPPEVASLGELKRAVGKAPWEMSAAEFDASAALRVEPTWTADSLRMTHLRQPPLRSMGLKRSFLRTGTELRLDVEWAPPGGYVVLMSEAEEAMPSDPRRSFVRAALENGIIVAPEILAGYPDLKNPPVG